MSDIGNYDFMLIFGDLVNDPIISYANPIIRYGICQFCHPWRIWVVGEFLYGWKNYCDNMWGDLFQIFFNTIPEFNFIL